MPGIVTMLLCMLHAFEYGVIVPTTHNNDGLKSHAAVSIVMGVSFSCFNNPILKHDSHHYVLIWYDMRHLEYHCLCVMCRHHA